MIEVFKTDVREPRSALLIIQLLQTVFSGYEVNFDLEDCDHILRIKSTQPAIQSRAVIDLLRNLGIHAEVLSEEIPSSEGAEELRPQIH